MWVYKNILFSLCTQMRQLGCCIEFNLYLLKCEWRHNELDLPLKLWNPSFVLSWGCKWCKSGGGTSALLSACSCTSCLTEPFTKTTQILSKNDNRRMPSKQKLCINPLIRGKRVRQGGSTDGYWCSIDLHHHLFYKRSEEFW